MSKLIIICLLFAFTFGQEPKETVLPPNTTLLTVLPMAGIEDVPGFELYVDDMLRKSPVFLTPGKHDFRYVMNYVTNHTYTKTDDGVMLAPGRQTRVAFSEVELKFFPQCFPRNIISNGKKNTPPLLDKDAVQQGDRTEGSPQSSPKIKSVDSTVVSPVIHCINKLVWNAETMEYEWQVFCK
jgi:hypothetical protein